MFANQARLSSIPIDTNNFSFRKGEIPFRIKASSSTVESPKRKKITTAAAEAENLYEVLQLKRCASPDQIKAAYRSLVKKYHPDAKKKKSGPGDSCDFIEIHNAYSTLSDPIARARYDNSISISHSNAHGGVGFRFSSGVLTLTHTNYPEFVGHRTKRWETDQCW